MAEFGPRSAWSGLRNACGTIRVFLRYLFRERVLTQDLSSAVEHPQRYRLAGIPRSISWDDVRRVLEGVDRRTATGRRDYAILLLLVTYGLRAREIAAMTLDDLDWRNERLRVPERKAGHSTGYPLSSVVGEAIVAYLKNGRPESNDRRIFFRSMAPFFPIGSAAISSLARNYLRKAEIRVLRLAHAAAHLRAEIGRGRLPSEVDRRLCWTSPPFLDADVQQGRHRGAPPSCSWRRGGGVMRSRWTGFQSLLADDIQGFLDHKRALGCRFEVEDRSLRLLDSYLVDLGVRNREDVTPDLINRFLASRPRSRPRSYNHLLCTVRRLFEWMQVHGRIDRSPVQTRPRRATSQRARSSSTYPRHKGCSTLHWPCPIGQGATKRGDLSRDLCDSLRTWTAGRRSVSPKDQRR